jgi:hypothetical protein
LADPLYLVVKKNWGSYACGCPLGAHSFFHGPAWVRKSLLLRLVIPEFIDVLYGPAEPNPTGPTPTTGGVVAGFATSVVYRALPARSGVAGEEDRGQRKGFGAGGTAQFQFVGGRRSSCTSLAALAAAIRALMLNWSVPVVAESRSAHMEDAGFVQPIFNEWAERFALRNFDPELSRIFAARVAKTAGLTAGNLNQFLDRVVEYGGANPGAMLRMLRMATVPKYSNKDQIKIAPLYIDYKIAMVAQ